MNKDMSPITIVMLCFSLLGAFDLIIGNKFGLGEQFERGIMLLGTMAMSMIGMIVLAPLMAHLLRPAVEWCSSIIPFEPSVIPSIFLANDMGGAPLAIGFATTEQVGYFNGLIVAATMGATISYTLPFSMRVVDKERHNSLMLGLLCGVVTVPIGCLVAGLVVSLPLKALLASVIPLFIFAGLLAVGLFLIPDTCLKGLKNFGEIIKIVILIGLAIGILEGLTGMDIVPYTAPIEDGIEICAMGAMVLSGAFPLIYVLSKLLDKPMKKIGQKMGINATAALGLLATLASCTPTIGTMKDMDDQGLVLNAAFSVSAAFVFGEHLAFTMSFNSDFVVGMIVGKLVSGIAALVVAMWLYNIMNKKKTVYIYKEKTDENGKRQVFGSRRRLCRVSLERSGGGTP